MTGMFLPGGFQAMKTYKVLLLAVTVGVGLSVSVQAGSRPAASRSQVASAPARSTSSSSLRFSGGRMAGPSQRFSPIAVRSMPTAFRPHINSTGNIGRHEFTPRTFSPGNDLTRFENGRAQSFGSFRNNRENRLGQIQNRRSDGLGEFANRRGDQSGSISNRALGSRSNNVFARRSADWHRDWNRNCDHWWRGHRCRFVNGSWFIFDLGFYPWYGYPYDYYGYDYYYPYSSPYAYDPGVYDQGVDPNYYGEGTYNSSDQNTDSTVAAAQERLARQGYYRGQIDGVLGPETHRAIRRYQSDHGLPATGYLTTETRQSLGSRRAARY
jgi:hypothetical protein